MTTKLVHVILFAAVLSAVGCAGWARPIRETDVIGSGPAVETTFRVKERLAVAVPFGRVFILPPGEYRPTHIDRHGVFYASPTGVTERQGDSERQIMGGIHQPTEVGTYYSFPSLFVDLGDGSYSKYPLPAEVIRGYGRLFVFTRNGQEVIL
jgi:hypothetical protein